MNRTSVSRTGLPTQRGQLQPLPIDPQFATLTSVRSSLNEIKPTNQAAIFQNLTPTSPVPVTSPRSAAIAKQPPIIEPIEPNYGVPSLPPSRYAKPPQRVGYQPTESNLVRGGAAKPIPAPAPAAVKAGVSKPAPTPVPTPAPAVAKAGVSKPAPTFRSTMTVPKSPVPAPPASRQPLLPKGPPPARYARAPLPESEELEEETEEEVETEEEQPARPELQPSNPTLPPARPAVQTRTVPRVNAQGDATQPAGGPRVNPVITAAQVSSIRLPPSKSAIVSPPKERPRIERAIVSPVASPTAKGLTSPSAKGLTSPTAKGAPRGRRKAETIAAVTLLNTSEMDLDQIRAEIMEPKVKNDRLKELLRMFGLRVTGNKAVMRQNLIVKLNEINPISETNV